MCEYWDIFKQLMREDKSFRISALISTISLIISVIALILA